ncbi:hypothetical protein ACLBWT_17170 [Paenibacillus sp. D51F]
MINASSSADFSIEPVSIDMVAFVPHSLQNNMRSFSLVPQFPQKDIFPCIPQTNHIPVSL